MSLLLRDLDDGYTPHDGLFFGFFVLLMFACFMSVTMMYLRRRQRLARQATTLPSYQRRGHHRSLTITSTPTVHGQDRVFVYDEKMNLIANSHGPSDSPVPEIRVTFPEETDQQGQKMAGRVVVVRITDTGSVGLEPLHQENLPPYQQSDAERYQSLDLNRIGGLREGQARPNQPRWS